MIAIVFFGPLDIKCSLLSILKRTTIQACSCGLLKYETAVCESHSLACRESAQPSSSRKNQSSPASLPAGQPGCHACDRRCLLLWQGLEQGLEQGLQSLLLSCPAQEWPGIPSHKINGSLQTIGQADWHIQYQQPIAMAMYGLEEFSTFSLTEDLVREFIGLLQR